MTSKIAHLSTRSVRYLEAGGGKKAAVWLHAFPLSADQWLPQLARVPPGWRVVAPDLRGFRGRGPAFEEPGLDDVSVDTYARDVLELMTHLEIKDAVVGGVSMGGYVAFALLRQAPKRVRGLVLANTRATPDSEQARAGRERTIALVMGEGPEALAREMLPKLLGATTQREQPDLVEVVHQLITANSREGLAAALRALRDRPDSTPMLESIACPTTIIHGGEDAIIPRADSDAMHARIPGSKLIVLPQAGHLSNLERGSEEFSTVLA